MDEHELDCGLTEDEEEAIVAAVNEASGERPATEEDINHVIKWAEETRARAICLEMVLDGVLTVQPCPDCGEVVFQQSREERARWN